MEIGWALGHPGNEFSKTRMRTQRGDRAKVTRTLGLGQRGMDFVVANLVQ